LGDAIITLMTDSIPSPTPNFTLAEGFVLPPLDTEELRIANEVFSTENYTSAPLIDAAAREWVLGCAYPQRPVGYFACRGFVIHTMQQEEHGIAVDTIIAPPPELDKIAFLESCLQLNLPVLPEADFKKRATSLRDVTAALGRTGIPAATGVHIGVDINRPTMSFAALSVPRVYINELSRRQSIDTPDQYGIKTSAALFNYLTSKQLEALRG